MLSRRALSALLFAAATAFHSSDAHELRGLGKKCFDCSKNHDPCKDEGEGYYAHCDEDMFVQCDDELVCHEMECAPGTVWDNDEEACAMDIDVLEVGECDLPKKCKNPCTAKNIKKGELYHEHCKDDKLFVQCDKFGGCAIMHCSKGTEWDQDMQSCVHKRRN
mmetsp:Transcript_8154/g.17244  ORF Transcript_8154/g.17244 Transcript_8154/m.17244 type:complete len:163 (-) Transcript_8154:79-567(-)|eukprot:CAMPEP_0183295640 /NCGR_PEP_ID=MMETSP0160_2-20130417/3525_1 /TAXON_ID=2839 ORGANISM="Odontella Sinensis, Strain Grunow 1884" /NCGR_SAMPLE_ID=MMETSP0160_2 /ASSEMBLY_ACC=CAM_ASM_000250 /LENGTH=162 /DNA_ID=CAMNT_0025457155 /DNA_START=246 /DNA_END=734 /DNA_ORIENTATION=-